MKEEEIKQHFEEFDKSKFQYSMTTPFKIIKPLTIRGQEAKDKLNITKLEEGKVYTAQVIQKAGWDIKKLYFDKNIVFGNSLEDEKVIELFEVLKISEDKEEEIVEKGELNVISLRQMLDSPIPEIEWRVHNVVPKQGITFLAGTAGSMKSFCAMQMAIACATGTPWLEQYDTEKGNVLYIDEENGNVTVPSRFNKLVNGHKLKDGLFDNLQISIFNNIVLDSETYMLKILIEKYKPQLVIIDSMVRCMEGEEDKSSDVKKVFQNLKEFMEQGISFVLIHHTTKRETYNMEGLRGSGDFAAFADSVLMFKPGREGYCNVRSVKNRHIAIEELNEFYFQLENETDDSIKLQWKGLKDEQGDIIERCIEEIKEWMANEKLSRFTTAQVRKEVKDKGFSDNTMYSALKQLTEAKLVTKLKKGNYLTNQESLIQEEEVTD